ncbi:hypothetical protein [Mesorhizobium dulcispinae]|uniref:hypothetical protein n=1 Tax=Mesorhizobium dulcispinae TaxID=3072316 RepID=UPI002A2464BF|nr:hypothetical protein [Mesorhizobium sp. VK23D]MDX8522044.1 hypothetical protein [Mesorhizobium sp. VK23D]
MEIFERLEALIDAPGAETVNEARSMLRQFESVVTADAIHQFLLDLMTLVFVVDAAPQNYHAPVRKLVQVRLAMLKMLGEASA